MDWDAQMRARYYFTPQGSRLMPRDWFLALEQTSNETLFATRANLATFGFIFAESDAGTGLNADGLPIGFALDPYLAPGPGRWLGLTCAACHTAEVTHRGTRLRIEGAPAALDFDAFGAALNQAVQAAARDPAKLRRMTERVAARGGSEAMLQAGFAAYAAASQAHWAVQRPAVTSGPGRVDALGQILNALAAIQLNEPGNAQPPAAPTSYPFLWTAPRQDWVQWAPIAGNPIARNAGEVLGVFGHAELVTRPWPRDLSGTSPVRFASTVRFRDLFELERWIDALRPPPWPDHLFGRLDEPLWRQGRDLVAANCTGCHTVASVPLAGSRYIPTRAVPLPEVGTDDAYTRALTSRRIYTGAVADLFENRPVVSAAAFFGTVVERVTMRGLDALNLSPAEALAYVDGRVAPPPNAPPGTPPEPWQTDPRRFVSLKAGPLIGLWATGPFLHNGSVPTVEDLLLPPNQRPRVFWTGGREIDAARLGFVSAEAPGLFRFDTSLPGNGNGGHAFPATPFAAEQRRAVLEYLKDPERFPAGAATGAR